MITFEKLLDSLRIIMYHSSYICWKLFGYRTLNNCLHAVESQKTKICNIKLKTRKYIAFL